MTLLDEVLELGRECETSITGMPAELVFAEQAIQAIRAELKMGRKAYQELRELEHQLVVLGRPRDVTR